MPSYIFKLPDLGEGVVEGEIVAWHVKLGDAVREDQPLVDVMTDKATVTIPSIVSGRVVKTHGEPGDLIAVGSDLIRFEVGEPVEVASAGAASAPPAGHAVNPPHNGDPTSSGDGPPAGAGIRARFAAPPRAVPLPERPMASPAVRRRAREKGVELSKLAGTGRGGRITDADIENYLRTGGDAAGRAPRVKRAGTTEIHTAGLRRPVAAKTSTGAATFPQFSYIEEVDITELSALRDYLNKHSTSDEPHLTYMPFIMLGLVKAFARFPQVNALYDARREVVTRYEAVHLGIATPTERGLCVPVVKNVESMDLREAARELRRVTQAASHNTIRSDELAGSTFTITNLGKMGGLAATPVINYPEVGILGVHQAHDRAVVHKGQIAVRHMINFSASFDQRVVDGMDGAAMIQCLKDCLQHPALIFLE